MKSSRPNGVNKVQPAIIAPWSSIILSYVLNMYDVEVHDWLYPVLKGHRKMTWFRGFRDNCCRVDVEAFSRSRIRVVLRIITSSTLTRRRQGRAADSYLLSARRQCAATLRVALWWVLVQMQCKRWQTGNLLVLSMCFRRSQQLLPILIDEDYLGGFSSWKISFSENFPYLFLEKQIQKHISYFLNLQRAKE